MFRSGVWVYVAMYIDLCGSVGVGILVGVDVDGEGIGICRYRCRDGGYSGGECV